MYVCVCICVLYVPVCPCPKVNVMTFHLVFFVYLLVLSMFVCIW